ncbi:related to phosphoinositide-specific phospholipase C [Lecanosticta acicola]|uniref:Phosphoinositide phospholipase C n=1 Tax=Lecanosticta acicola TaxID=111012 RepID=A0AAI9EFY7_9PEZI|nr:related to phosphoinositide-specific phospholipase C [Lecanosticta acicola]
MNLPSDTHGQDALPAPNASVAGSTLRAPTATPHPVPAVNTNIAMTVTPAAAAGVTPSATARSSSFPTHVIRAPPSVSQESLPDSNFSPFMYASPSPIPRATAPERTFSERSPSPHARAGPPSAMAEAMSVARSPSIGRSPSLIRRLSRGASSRLRRRASTQHSLRMRDPSAGPTLMRRRSDSNGASDIGQDVSDLDLDSTAEDVIEDSSSFTGFRDRNNALGINLGRPSVNSSNPSSIFEGGIAPASSVVLENGTWLTKLTKRSSKRIKLWLDSNSARVCWHTSNPAKSFFIDDVREVRVGADSRNARDDVQIPEEQEGRWVTIVYDIPERSKGRAIKTMHVLMPDDYLLNLWTDALNTVTRERIEIMNALSSSPEKSEKSMAMAWRQVMARKGQITEERFSLADARWLCRKLEINCSDSAVRTHFKAVSSDEDATLDYEQYRSFVQSFRERKDLQHIYRNMQFGTDLDMDMETFFKFLKDEQSVDVLKDRSYWESVFEKYSRPSQNRPMLSDAGRSVPQRTMNLQTFQNFMTSSHSAPLAQLKGEPTLDRPLNEYFISSSHNTYLLGRQVAGASSVEGYIAALVKGCRCVEIDCWDGDDGRPMVTHGRTMTTKIPFEDCVSVVAKYAFNSSPYPLIVSLEVHCNPEQQLTMVELMKKYFGTMMVTEPLLPNSSSLPSPEELRNRILIKVKAAHDIDPSQLLQDASNGRVDGRSRARSITNAFNRTPSMENQSAVSSPLAASSVATSPSENNAVFTPRGSTTSGPSMTPSSSADDSDEVAASADKMKKRSKTSRIVDELGKLGVYTQGIKFNGFQAPNAKTYNHVYSFAENTFDRLCTKNTDNKALLETHNMRSLMRVYPGPRRIDSSNFNPLQSWRRGVQMAALNWQTYDVHQQVNEAMFAAGSDRLGYVLKPDELRHAKHLPIADTIAETPEKQEKKGKKVVRFSVDILSAQRLPRPRNQNAEAGMNPYIEFEMYSAEDKARGNATAEGGTDASAQNGTSGIGSPLRKRTRIVEGNGFDPQYYQNISMSVETKYPSLIFVRWTVWNAPEGKKSASNATLLATFTAKLNSLQQGYRHLPLFNPQGEQYRDAKLFVKIRKGAPVPLQHQDNAYGIMEPSASPRPESIRTERSWKQRIFSRNPSQRRPKDNTSDIAGPLSRTSSMDRDSIR